MAHLTSWFGEPLAIDVEKSIVNLQYVIQPFVYRLATKPFLSNDVDHYRRQDKFCITKRMAQYDAPQHIELRTVMGFNSMMSTVVYPRSGFIYINFIFHIYK